MKPLDAEATLRIAEAGHVLSPWQLAALLAGAAAPELTEHDVYALPLGERDRLILQLRRVMFGDELKLAFVCPQCSARLEASLPLSQWTDASTMRTFVWAGAESRVPSTEDLVAVLGVPAERAGLVLLRRCVEAADEMDDMAAAPAVEPWLRSVQEHDPGADLHFEVSCESCGHRWTLPLDPATFVWKEMAAVARRLIGEVHRLASRYGWSESDILALPAWRRRAYLECES